MIAYIAVGGGRETVNFCTRFANTFAANPPGQEAELITICNGGPLSKEAGLPLANIGSIFFARSNDGWDIGGYSELAQSIDTDFLICLGQSCYFHRPGWLKRLIDARHKFGEGMYGIFSSNSVRPHLNTTAFAVDAALLRSWPKVTTKEGRYQFEHGENSFWRRVQGLKKTVCLVNWDSEYAPMFWRMGQNIFWRGDQSNCLVFCVHCDRYRDANEETKRVWAANADRPYK